MDLAKSYEYFQPDKFDDRIHILGVGSVGSGVAELLARFGFTKFSLYDFDIVESKNIVNQIYDTRHIGMLKLEAIKNIMLDINPEIGQHLKLYPQGYTNQRLSGIVFLCIDDIELRHKIAQENKANPMIRAMFDFRTRLTTSQHYAADWRDSEMIDNFIESMNFTNEEARQATQVSACGVSLCVAPTVRLICNIGVMNLINFLRTGQLRHFCQVDIENFYLDAYMKEK